MTRHHLPYKAIDRIKNTFFSTKNDSKFNEISNTKSNLTRQKDDEAIKTIIIT